MQKYNHRVVLLAHENELENILTASGDGARDGHGHDPRDYDVPEEGPVDGFFGAHAAREHHRADLAVRGRHGYVQEGRAEHGHGAGQLYDEATRGRDLGQVLADGLDHTTAQHPEADADAHATVEQDPLGRVRLLLDGALLVDEKEADERADRVRDVVAAVRERAEDGREHLEEREETGCLGRVGVSERVHLVDRPLAPLGRHLQDVLLDVVVQAGHGLGDGPVGHDLIFDVPLLLLQHGLDDESRVVHSGRGAVAAELGRRQIEAAALLGGRLVGGLVAAGRCVVGVGVVVAAAAVRKTLLLREDLGEGDGAGVGVTRRRVAYAVALLLVRVDRATRVVLGDQLLTHCGRVYGVQIAAQSLIYSRQENYCLVFRYLIEPDET